MKPVPEPAAHRRDAVLRAAVDMAVGMAQADMVVAVGSGPVAALVVEALAKRCREGLSLQGIASSEQVAGLVKQAGIPLTTLAEHRQVDLMIDGADAVQSGTLHLIKGGGAFVQEKIAAAASRCLAIVVDETKLVERLGGDTAIPVEVCGFGLEATQAALESLGASVSMRASAGTVGDGNRILECRFGPIADAPRLEGRIRNIVGVVDCGLFTGRADPVFVAAPDGARRLDSVYAHLGVPPILMIMGVSGAGKSTVARAVADRLGWPFQEGDALHPEANVEKMHQGIPLTDADRAPWLQRVADWIDGQRAAHLPGIITCSALKRTYRQVIIGDRAEVRLVYLRGGHDLLAQRLAHRSGHFMPPSLLQSQMDTLEEPEANERPLVFDVDTDVGRIVERIAQLVGG